MCRSEVEWELYDRRVEVVLRLAKRGIGFTYNDIKSIHPNLFPGPRQFNDFMKEVVEKHSDVTFRHGKNGIKVYYTRPNLYVNSSKVWDLHTVLKRRAADILNTSSTAQQTVV